MYINGPWRAHLHQRNGKVNHFYLLTQVIVPKLRLRKVKFSRSQRGKIGVFSSEETDVISLTREQNFSLVRGNKNVFSRGNFVHSSFARRVENRVQDQKPEGGQGEGEEPG